MVDILAERSARERPGGAAACARLRSARPIARPTIAAGWCSNASISRCATARSSRSSANRAPANRPFCASSPGSSRRARAGSSIAASRSTGPVQGVAMVFQSFALFPWLTVLGNVELGLEAQGVSAAERRRRAVDAIDVIGLDGFENAYPKELSGGMRQRVGFARALVVNPDILLLDEPFSQLDVLTAETLRNDLSDLWMPAPDPDQGDPDGLAQHRGGGRDGRPHPDIRQRPRPHQRRGAGHAAAAARLGQRRRSARSSTRSIRC